MVVQLIFIFFFGPMIHYENENFSLWFQENISDVVVNILVANLD